MLSHLSLDLLSIDADKDNGEKESIGPDPGNDHTSTNRPSPSIRLKAHWRDSSHSTLVAVPNDMV
jgi:hypothetical protein